MENQIILTGKEAIEYRHFKESLNKFYKHKVDSFEIKELMNTVFDVFRKYTAARVALDEICIFLSNADIEKDKNEELDSALETVLSATGRGPDSSGINDWNINFKYLTEVLNIVAVIKRQ